MRVRRASPRGWLEQGLEQGSERGLEQGLKRGISRGAVLGRRALLAELLEAKFGTIPARAAERLAGATGDQLDRWGGKLLTAATFGQTIGKR